MRFVSTTPRRSTSPCDFPGAERRARSNCRFMAQVVRPAKRHDADNCRYAGAMGCNGDRFTDMASDRVARWIESGVGMALSAKLL